MWLARNEPSMDSKEPTFLHLFFLELPSLRLRLESGFTTGNKVITTCCSKMTFFSETDGSWSHKGSEKPIEPSAQAEEYDHGKNEEGDPSTTHEAPSTFIFEEAFQLTNAHLDTLIVDFNTFKEDHGRQIQALRDSQQAFFHRIQDTQQANFDGIYEQ
ncbi:hypothetical protein TorRG33x02_166390 [Trema orientale]|uniref:Uncharacterized protein n=1 Tax=Trema orientale TaxID=63057 RepID=A0A2P5EPG0_TREOI|nr:hypothetical protein TorRG33x02_166390 [Trema orientale]